MGDMPFLISRRRALVGALLLVAVLVLAGRYLLGSSAATSVSAPPLPARAPAVVEAPRLVVDVVGAVRLPGLYRLPAGSRTADAVARAGGATRGAALALVNLAAPLADGEQVVVPRSGQDGAAAVSAPAVAGGGRAPSGPVHLNTATLEQLDSLPGIGPLTAQKILDYRREHGAFRSVEELDAVPGIGPSRLDQLRKLVMP